MQVGSIVKNIVPLVIIEGVEPIPAGSTGRVVKIDPLPEGMNPNHWFGIEVHFGGFMTTEEVFPCKITELSVA